MPYKNLEQKRECDRRKATAWRAKNPGKNRENKRAWYKKNKSKASRYERVRYRQKIGWDETRVSFAMSLQGSACAICRKIFTKTPCADHAHVSPPIPRGLLCDRCNRGLGFFLETPDILRNAAAYIEFWKGKQ